MTVRLFQRICSVTLVLGASVASVTCGSNLKTGPDAQICSSAEENTQNERRPHFVTRLIRGLSDEGATTLYRLNSGTMTAEPVIIRKSDSADAWALRDMQSGEILFLERFAGQSKSRLTRAACDVKEAKREFGSLPANTFGLARLTDGSLLAAGWNDGSLTRLSQDFKTTLLDRSAPPSGTTDAPLAESDKHFNSLMLKDGRVYVLTTGYDLRQFKPAQAKVMALSEGLDTVSALYPVPECFNAYQDYTLQTAANEIIVGCNPQYQGSATNTLPVRLVRVSVSDKGQVETRELAKPKDANTNIMVPGGVSRDGDWVFVTEETVTEKSAQTPSPGLFRQSYWLSLKSGERRMMGKVGGRVIFDRVEEQYLLSCRASSLPGACASGGFVVLKADSWDKPEAAEWKAVKFEYDFFQFERSMF